MHTMSVMLGYITTDILRHPHWDNPGTSPWLIRSWPINMPSLSPLAEPSSGCRCCCHPPWHWQPSHKPGGLCQQSSVPCPLRRQSSHQLQFQCSCGCRCQHRAWSCQGSDGQRTRIPGLLTQRKRSAHPDHGNCTRRAVHRQHNWSLDRRAKWEALNRCAGKIHWQHSSPTQPVSSAVREVAYGNACGRDPGPQWAGDCSVLRRSRLMACWTRFWDISDRQHPIVGCRG